MTKSPRIPTDELLIAGLWVRFRAGDKEAFDQLAQRRYRTLFNYATRFTKDREFIKDSLQDLFLELWHRRQNLADTPYVTVYLIRSLRNNIIRRLRQDSQLGWGLTGDTGYPEVDQLDEYHEPTIESRIIGTEQQAEQTQVLRRALDKLPERQREAVFLKFYQGLSNEKIAQIMNVERQTIANFLHRAVTNLRVNLVSPVGA